MKENINENDQIRNSLNKIRLLQEEIVSTNQIDTNTEQSKTGEQITFDTINTVGFLNSNTQLSNESKNQLITTIGEFIKSSGLILDSISIYVEDSRILLSTDTIKNPGIDVFKSISFDTNLESPIIEVNSGTLSLTEDFTNILSLTVRTFNDNNVGKNKLISLTQGQIQ